MALFSTILAHCLLPLLCSASAPWVQATSKPAFTFLGTGYYHRYSKNDLHEYTPKSQSNLNKWTDMVTVNRYPSVADGEALATTANAVLERYKTAKARVVRTDSVPRTETRPAEHLIVVLFPRPTFIEASFSRFLLDGGKGASIVYSHRVYGKKAGNAMSAWLEKNGPKVEAALMKFGPVPKR